MGADLARSLGVSRARVTQTLRLLRLSPKVVKACASLGDPLPAPIVMERSLRALAAWPRREQVLRFRTVVAGCAKR